MSRIQAFKRPRFFEGELIKPSSSCISYAEDAVVIRKTPKSFLLTKELYDAIRSRAVRFTGEIPYSVNYKGPRSTELWVPDEEMRKKVASLPAKGSTKTQETTSSDGFQYYESRKMEGKVLRKRNHVFFDRVNIRRRRAWKIYGSV